MQKGISVYKLYGIIYCARNITNDKRHICQTTRSLNRRKKEHNNKEFYVFNKNNLEFVGKWDDRKRCSNELKVTRTTITRSLDLKNKNSRNKYIFYYKNEIPIELQYNIKDVI